MVFFPHEWITRPEDVREHVRVQQPDRSPPAKDGAVATGTAGPGATAGPPPSPPVPSEPLAPAPVANHGAAPGS